MRYSDFKVINNGHQLFVISFKTNKMSAILTIYDLYQIMQKEESTKLINKYYGMIDRNTHFDKIVFLDREDGKQFLEEFLIYYNMYLLRGEI